MDPNNPLSDPHLAYLMPIIAIGGLIFIAVLIVPLWQIAKKAGLSPWLSLLIFVPFGPLVVLYVLAFVRWKVVPAPELAAYPQMYPAPAAYPATTSPAYPPAAYPPAAPPPANPGDPSPRS